MKRERIAIGIHHGIEDVDELTRMGRLAEKKGFESIWVTEDYFSEETFSMLGALSAVTKDINLGVGVVNPYTRIPPLLAMGAATVDRMSKGRFLLGLGRSEKERIERKMGIRYGDALVALEESAKIIRDLMKGEVVNFNSQFYKLTDVSLHIKPFRNHIPIYFAATGPKTLSLAGRLADGVLLNVYSPIGYVKYAVEEIRRSANQSARKTDVACFLSVRITDDFEGLKPRLKQRIVDQLLPKGVGELLLEKGGYDTTILEPLRKSVAKGRMKEAVGFIGDDIVEDFCVAGSINKCERRVEEYRKAGVDTPIILPRLEQYDIVAGGFTS